MCKIGFSSLLLALLLVIPSLPEKASAGDASNTGDMIWVAFDYAPDGWLPCDGRTLLISQYNALYSLLGIQYGGDGVSTFKLPDMRGRLMIHSGQGTGLAAYAQGASGGAETVALTTDQLPSHTHSLKGSSATATSTTPDSGSVYGRAAAGNLYGPNPAATMSSSAVGSAGGGTAHNNMMPYTTLNCLICVNGLWPTRN